MTGNPPRRWLRWIALAAFLGGSVTLAWYVSVSNSGSAATSLLLGVAQLAIAALTFRLDTRAASAAVEPQEALTRAAEALATEVRRQWNDEIGNRRLRHPRPLRLRWEPVPGLAAPPPNITIARGQLEGTGSIELPATALVTQFRSLPVRQLLVLGMPGAGKSTLAILFVMAALGRSTAGHAGRADPNEPVPVLLTLAGWNPELETIRDWTVRRIAEDYPELSNAALYGPAAPSRLVQNGLVLPVLDGLDEMPAALMIAAIEGLNDVSGDGGLDIVVLCRRREYEAVVVASGRLTQAAVLDIQPISVQDSIDFLTAHEPAGATRWSPVTARMLADPAGALATALATPLMTSLARTVYEPSGTAPAEMCSMSAVAEIENHLLGRLLPTIYSDPRGGSTKRTLTLLAHHLDRRLRTPNLAWWQLNRLLPRAVPVVLITLLLAGLGALTAVVARRFEDLEAVDPDNLILILLGSATPTYGLLLGLGFGLAAGFISAVNTDRSSRRQPGHRSRRAALVMIAAATLRDGLVSGAILAAALVLYFGGRSHFTNGQFWSVGLAVMVFGAVAGVAVSLLLQGLDAGRGLTPNRASFRLRALLPLAGSGMFAGLLFGVVSGALVGLLAAVKAVVAQSPTAVLDGFRSAAFTAGVLTMTIGLPVGIGRWLRAPVGFDDPVSPRSVLRGDLLTQLAVAASCALAAGVGTHFLDAGDDVVDFAGFTGVWAGVMIFAIALLGSGAPSVLFTITCLWLALWGRTPLRLMHLLEDARRRGVLRQVGAVYQFRHARLQAYLADEHERAYRPTVPGRLTSAVIRPAGAARSSRMRRWRTAMSLCAVVAVPGAILAVNLPSVQRDLDYAETAGREADARRLISMADERQVEDPTLAIKLRIAAATIDQDASAAEMLRTYVWALSRGRPELWARGTDLSGAGQWVLVVDGDRALTAYEVAGAVRRVPLRSAITDATVTPDARWALALTDAGVVLGWRLSADLSPNSEPRRFGAPGRKVTGATVGDDGRWLVLEHEDGSYSVVDLSRAEAEPHVITVREDATTRGSFDTDARAMAVLNPDGRLETWVLTDAGPTSLHIAKDVELGTFAAGDGLVGFVSSSADRNGWLWAPGLRPDPIDLGPDVVGLDVADRGNVLVRYGNGPVKLWNGVSGTKATVADDAVDSWVSADHRWFFARTAQEIRRWYIPTAGAEPEPHDPVAVSCKGAACARYDFIPGLRPATGLGGAARTFLVGRWMTSGPWMFDLESAAPARIAPAIGPLSEPPFVTPDGRWAFFGSDRVDTGDRPARYTGWALAERVIRPADFGFDPSYVSVVDAGRWVTFTGNRGGGGLVAFWPPGTAAAGSGDELLGNPIWRACDIVGEDLSSKEWLDLHLSVPYRRTCP